MDEGGDEGLTSGDAGTAATGVGSSILRGVREWE